MKLWTITVTEYEIKNLELILDELSDEIYNLDKTKTMTVHGFGLAVYAVVCSEDTFNKIQTKINGIRIY